MRTRRWPKDPKRYRWLIDGHNAIFTQPALEALQTGGKQAAARRLFESMLDRFAAAHGLRLTVVYDGNESTQNPDAGTRGWITSQYSLRPNEDADDRIIGLASEAVQRREKVVVVTSDRKLGQRLPSSVRTVEPVELFRRLEAAAGQKEDEQPPGDYSDIEAHFLSLEPPAKPSRSRKRTPPPTRPPSPQPRSAAKRAAPTPSPQTEPPPVGPPKRDREALARKKARGRRKQERRLNLPRKPKRRPRGR